jgi:hypothetical protein
MPAYFDAPSTVPDATALEPDGTAGWVADSIGSLRDDRQLVLDSADQLHLFTPNIIRVFDVNGGLTHQLEVDWPALTSYCQSFALLPGGGMLLGSRDSLLAAD